jgi:hypothetical protein
MELFTRGEWGKIDRRHNDIEINLISQANKKRGKAQRHKQEEERDTTSAEAILTSRRSGTRKYRTAFPWSFTRSTNSPSVKHDDGRFLK